MDISEQIETYIASQPQVKRKDMMDLHKKILEILPDGKLWFEDGKNSDGKIVSNPSIGYGNYTMRYTDGKTREYYQVGMSANTTGISVYILGIPDKKYLADTYSKELGKASISGYCIKFKKLEDINLPVLQEAIKNGAEISAKN